MSDPLTHAQEAEAQKQAALRKLLGGDCDSSDYVDNKRIETEDRFVAKLLSIFGLASPKKRVQIARRYCGSHRLTVDAWNDCFTPPFKVGVTIPDGKETFAKVIHSFTSQKKFQKTRLFDTYLTAAENYSDELIAVFVRYKDLGKDLVFTTWGRHDLEDGEFRLLFRHEGTVFMLQPAEQWFEAVCDEFDWTAVGLERE